ncbi:MAG: tryptophan--tRNA ligase, partial [Firmicutes bacterium]|nr:tryptophan--tRNA ligase [Bacillota bacterium]
QSDIEVIPAISWILETQTPFGELSRMTQFKDKSAKNELFGAGLFSYPSLMAADILAMDADYVPVGKDQKQHLEFARNTAERMNKKYGKLFIVPQELINENTAKIYDLLDPTKKMSKSDETLNGVIMLSDDEKTVRKKISRAVTDSDAKVKFDPKKKPGVSNLLSIYAGFKNITPVEAAKTFKNSNYGELKNAVADAVWAKLSEIQTNYAAIILNGSLDQILEAGKQKAERLARMKYAQMREALGLRI